jgi:hypothetical protein
MVLGKSQIQMFIISEKTDLIREKIIYEEDAGVTLFDAYCAAERTLVRLPADTRRS